MRRALVIAVAAPAVVLAAGLALSLLLGVFGRSPIWPDYHLNLSEAAGTDDEAEVLRLIGYGEDPNLVRDVRAGVLFDRPTRLTPLEAAAVSGRVSMVARLLANGAVMDAAGWNRVRCLASGDDTARFLDSRRPDGALRRCDEISEP